MHSLTQLRFLSVAVAIAVLAGCSNGSAVAPNLPQQDGNHPLLRNAPSVFNAMDMLKAKSNAGQHFISFDVCPAQGPIKYVSDYNSDVIRIYVGKFAGQSPCGQITSRLLGPVGVYVKISNHDLYVANIYGQNILVFHRGQTAPYNVYSDPTDQIPIDVTVANDGTVLASNQSQMSGGEYGSISTWIGGPNGGTFVGNFPIADNSIGAYITDGPNGKVYYDGLDRITFDGALWSRSCPRGACGPQTQVMGVSFKTEPAGLAFDNAGELLVNDTKNQTLDIFKLPNPSYQQIAVAGWPVGLAINPLDHHLFIADTQNNDAAEYLYPSGKLVGTVPGVRFGLAVGIAVDP
ncbi:MAG TPA: hypothetical protein VII69_14400 [Candidatus Eremiobacteraceae bacterium]